MIQTGDDEAIMNHVWLDQTKCLFDGFRAFLRLYETCTASAFKQWLCAVEDQSKQWVCSILDS